LLVLSPTINNNLVKTPNKATPLTVVCRNGFEIWD
jgi:hypothetical protein